MPNIVSNSVTNHDFDSILVVSFGGPEGPDDVMPFLENVLRGKNVPRSRMLEVAEHYHRFGGVSPINAQNRALIVALRNELSAQGPDLPIYWGNRNWHPLLPDTLRQMRDDGMRRALVFVTSVFSSYSGCRQYREDLERAQQEVGEGVPECEKLRVFYNHPGFVQATVGHVREACQELPESLQSRARLVFSAHSIPQIMADGCDYVRQLSEACRLVAEQFPDLEWDLVYQSRSGPPSQPWLEPDICDHLRQLNAAGTIPAVIVVPIGFVSDHMEVLFDLDTEARELCDEIGLTMVRAKTAGTHPSFINMIGKLITERCDGSERLAIGKYGPSHDTCPLDCCPSGRPVA